MRKFIIWLSIFSVMNLIGCYYQEQMNPGDYSYDENSSMIITTKDTVYNLNGSDIRLVNDSLFVQRNTGAEVFLVMNNDDEYTGELLIVKDSTILLSNEYGLSDEELFNSSNQIKVIPKQNIKSVWILGENNHLIGLAIGIGIGAVLLAVASAEGKRDDKIVLGVLGLLSAATGFLIGAATSTYSKEVYNNNNPKGYSLNQLKKYSRFNVSESDFMKEIK